MNLEEFRKALSSEIEKGDRKKWLMGIVMLLFSK